MKHFISLALVVAFSACTTAKVRTDVTDSGPGPAPTNYQAQIKAYWQSALKDPGSLQLIRMGEPQKVVAYSATEAPHWYDAYADVEFTPVSGHKVCATYTAKNSFGGYVAPKTDVFFFDSHGRMIPAINMPKAQVNAFHEKGSFTAGNRVVFDACS